MQKKSISNTFRVKRTRNGARGGSSGSSSTNKTASVAFAVAVVKVETVVAAAGDIAAVEVAVATV